MDRVLPNDVRRTLTMRRIVRVAAPLAGLAAVLTLLPGWIRPSVGRARIRTAIVQTGPLEAVVTASGTVMPEVERVLASPVDARLLRVLKRAGMPVTAGDPIAELDLSESELAWDRLVTDVRVTDNEASRARLALARSLADLDGRIQRAELNLQLLTARADGQERLFAEGLASRQDAREARLAARQAAIELDQLRRERGHAEGSAALESESLALRREALDRQAAQARRLLDLGTARADRTGVVTWVLSHEGSLVRRGDVLARIADLRSFRVDAAVSDVHAARIRTGTPVRVQINDETRLEGTITDVSPSVEGGIVRFQVGLREYSSPLLRPDLRVDVLVITDRTPRTLKVRQGPFDDASGHAQTFVIRDNRAIRTQVRFGLRGSDEVEVLSGLREGDEVVISDMRDYLHLEELEVQ
jgi:HlyD family secretion protein